MTAGAQPALYAVVGNPVGHSLSPRIHASFAKQTGQALSYEAIELPLDGFVNGIRDLQQRGFAGVNVTVPFKREAWQLCDSLSHRAELAGAVNTLSFNLDGSIGGDNTDGIGLVRDLVDNLEVEINGRQLLVLGAGGAVRGVLGPLLDRSPARLILANRTAQKAEQLADDFSRYGTIGALPFDALAGQSFDLIINGTAAGLNNEIPPIPGSIVGANTACYDMMYDLSAPTAFVAWAQDQGAARAVDGLGMLVEQAAEAFSIWRGVGPDTLHVITALRNG
ncbi:MAG: shikimate dehydrogenase [Gammaproteobacteria bacterium]|nr:MAG: shikimate dehydrogenase [Gammaproteobacteria bacterium]